MPIYSIKSSIFPEQPATLLEADAVTEEGGRFTFTLNDAIVGSFVNIDFAVQAPAEEEDPLP